MKNKKQMAAVLLSAILGITAIHGLYRQTAV